METVHSCENSSAGTLPCLVDDRRATSEELLENGFRVRGEPGAMPGRVQVVLTDKNGIVTQDRFRPSARFAFGVIRFLVRPTDSAYHSFLDQCLFDRDDLIEAMGDSWEPFLAYNLDRSRTSSVKTAMRTLMKEVGVPTIPSETLERIAVPTTLIWGRDDRAIRLEIAEDASARYGWPLHVIDNAADDPKLERLKAFLEALYEVLGDNATTGRTAWTR